MSESIRRMLVCTSLFLVVCAALLFPVCPLVEPLFTLSVQSHSLCSVSLLVEVFKESDVFLPTVVYFSVWLILCWIRPLRAGGVPHTGPAGSEGQFNSWLRLFLAHPIHAPPSTSL